MDMREEAEISLANAITMGNAMNKLMGQCFPTLYGSVRPCGVRAGDCSGECSVCGNNPENK